ncbi:PREDICTED: protein CutA homolog isoform X1 [Xyrichtys novacula]|uniref:PREDICTED: protein CutA homolog isoform X1 n=1 Tax=Xyrichtys novacula TaxID=13765 RepID=A0AAV1GAL8_XYRNO|nr:PREDICTED: protein CutA homolog isoform X1 [Xyrichtys novacula]
MMADSFMLCSRKLLVLSVSLYPGLRSIGVQLHSALTGSYAPGHHSLILINSPNEQAARDIGRAIMERRLAASVNILCRTSTMYYWKDEIQDASEILMLVKTKTSRIQQISDYVRSVHPYANPEVLSFLVEDGSLAYMKWMDEAIPDD